MAGIQFAVTADPNDALRGFQQVQRGVKQMSSAVEKSGSSIDGYIDKLSAIGAAAGIAFSAAQLKTFAMHVANVRGQFQQLEVAFKTMLNSEEKASNLMGQLIDTAAKTPFGMNDITNGAKQLLAYGTAADEVNETLVRLGDIAAGLSIPLNDLIYLFGTTMTQGKLYTQDLRQFMGRGIPIAEELAKQFGVTKDKVAELVTAGKIGAEEVKKAIWSLTDAGSKFGGLMDAQSKTITGQISNIEDTIEQMFNELGKQSEGVINNTLSFISAAVEHWKEIGKVILTVIATYGAYKAAVLAVAAAHKIAKIAQTAGAFISLTREITSAKDAMVLLNMVTKASPLGFIVGIVAACATGLALFGDSAEDAAKMSERFGEAANKAAENVEGLYAVLDNVTVGSKAFKDAYDELKTVAEEYGLKMDDEAKSAAQLNEVRERLVELIKEEAVEREKANAINDFSTTYQEEQQKLQEELIDKMKDIDGGAGIARAMSNMISREDLNRMAELQRTMNNTFGKKHQDAANELRDIVIKYNTKLGEYLTTLKKANGEQKYSNGVILEARRAFSDYAYQLSRAKAEEAENTEMAINAADALEGKILASDKATESERLHAKSIKDSKKSASELRIELDRLITEYNNTHLYMTVEWEQINVPSWMKTIKKEQKNYTGDWYLTQAVKAALAEKQGKKYYIKLKRDNKLTHHTSEELYKHGLAYRKSAYEDKVAEEKAAAASSTSTKDKKTKVHKNNSNWNQAQENAEAEKERKEYFEMLNGEIADLAMEREELSLLVDMEEGYSKVFQQILDKRNKNQKDLNTLIKAKTAGYESLLEKQWEHKKEGNKGQDKWNAYKKQMGWTDEYFEQLFSVEIDDKGNFKGAASQIDAEFKEFEQKLIKEFTDTGKTIEDWAEHSKSIDLLDLFIEDRKKKGKYTETEAFLLSLIQWYNQAFYLTQKKEDEINKELEAYYKDRLRSYGGYLEERREKLDKLYDDREAIIAKMKGLAQDSEEWKRYANALEGVNKQIRDIDTDKLKGLLSLNRTNERSFLEQDYKEQRDDLTATLREAQEKRRGATTREEDEEAQRTINNINAAITELDKKHMQDLASFDAETMKSSDLWKSVFEDIGNATDESLSLMEKALVEFISQQKNLSPEKLKELRDALMQIQAQQFTNESNPFKKIAQSIDELAKKKKALDVVKDSLDYFYAYEQSAKGDKSIDKRYKAALASGDNEAIKAIQNEEVSIEVLDEKTGKVTETTMKYGEVLKLVARLTRDATDAEEEHTATLESAFEEIGKWNSRLKAVGQLFSDLGEAFGSNALQHIGEAIGMMTEVVDKAAEMGKMGAEIGGIWGAVAGASIGLFSSLSGAITKLLDARHERIIQRLARQIEDLDEKYQDLVDAVSEAYSKEAAALIEEQNELLRQQYDLIEQQKAEEEAKKGTDKDKIREYEKQQRDIQKQIEDNEQAAIDAIFGEDVNSAISSFADAYASAWENGNSKAKTARDFVKRMIKSMVSELMKANISGGMEALRAKMLAYWEDNIITEAERASLNRDAEALGKQLDEQFSWANDLFRPVDEAGEGTAGGFATMSQDSADELNGRFSAIQVQGEVKINLLSQIVAQNVARAEAMANISTDTRIASDALVELKGLAMTRNAMIDNISSYVQPLKEQLERIASDIHVKL